MQPVLQFIGVIHSGLKNKEDCPLQENENAPGATIEIFPEYTEGVKNIKAGTEIILFTWLHAADRSVVTCVPRKNYSASKIGVFSTRSPDRPNPIGMHTVKVLSVDENKMIKVAALEVLDQTPLIDIKPVIK